MVMGAACSRASHEPLVLLFLVWMPCRKAPSLVWTSRVERSKPICLESRCCVTPPPPYNLLRALLHGLMPMQNHDPQHSLSTLIPSDSSVVRKTMVPELVKNDV